MPAIKLKKAAAEHQAEKEREERERGEAEDGTVVKTSSPKKTKDPSTSLLRGLDPNILYEKRKRTIPAAEQKLIEWIESNLEKKEGYKVSLVRLYDLFGEDCSFDGTPVVDQTLFNKRILDKCGKEFALKESSSYKGLIKEKIAGGEKGQKVKADSLKLKLKDIIDEVLKEAGNPAKGLRFHMLKQIIAGNYPALRVDLRPYSLKIALEKGVRYGYIQLVRGVGQAGYYRLPTDEEPDEDEDAKKETQKEEPSVQNGESEEGTEKKEETPKSKPKAKRSKKKTAVEGEGEEKEKPEGEEGGEGDGGTEAEGVKKKKKKKSKKRPQKKSSYHVAPQRLEDTFALAMTYMSDPKRTSFGKMKRYFALHYPDVDVDTELRNAILNGEDKGYWKNVTGQGISGSFELLLDEFDPTGTEMIDMICSTFLACNEPKQASANLLKKYIIEYHPDYKIDSRPHLFKHALERAVNKKMVIQLSGLGASGTYQMWSPFTPSPALLAGEDDSDVEDLFDDVKEEMYVPRGTKSRGLAPKKPDRAQPMRVPPMKRSLSKKKVGKSETDSGSTSRGGRKSYAEDEEEEEEEEVEEEDDEPKPKKSRKSPAKKGKGKKAGTARGAKSKKGGKVSTKKRSSRKSKAKSDAEPEDAPVKKSSKRSKAQIIYNEEEDGSGNEEEPPTKKGSKKSKAQQREDEDFEEEAATPKKKPRDSGRRGSKVSYNEDEEEEEEVITVEYTPRKSKSRGGEEEEPTEAKSPSKRGKKKH